MIRVKLSGLVGCSPWLPMATLIRMTMQDGRIAILQLSLVSGILD